MVVHKVIRRNNSSTGKLKVSRECYKKSIEVVTYMTLPIELLEKPESQISPKPVNSITEEELEEGKKICLRIALRGASREAVIRMLKNRITTFA